MRFPLIQIANNSPLREDHPFYDERGAAAIVRMRGWVLLALARASVSDAALIFVLEELDTGIDAYLVTAAARALRSYPRPTEALAPFVMRALTRIRYRDEPVSFENYGDYANARTESVRSSIRIEFSSARLQSETPRGARDGTCERTSRPAASNRPYAFGPRTTSTSHPSISITTSCPAT
jgi:hypothetical protein